MKLKPTEILKHLGFVIPEEGIEINENDAFLLTSALKLAGKSIDVDKIEDAELAEVHGGLAGIVSGWSAAGQIAPMAVNHTASPESLLKLRSTLAVVLKVNFGHQAQTPPSEGVERHVAHRG